jgi:hypothetical protein
LDANFEALGFLSSMKHLHPKTLKWCRLGFLPAMISLGVFEGPIRQTKEGGE